MARYHVAWTESVQRSADIDFPDDLNVADPNATTEALQAALGEEGTPRVQNLVEGDSDLVVDEEPAPAEPSATTEPSTE